ncbi:glycosyltransferase [Geitlerinema sp. PCC 7407]|uniref:glycosyltransferase n=1 Tax=Geitlerinema sp. PCC 7407 TaxID=1173025 RepID=UPI00029FD4AD|nr:glycosyltransferase [Geitlerinema sp. PCC 7407]AFY68133.1 glycosyl transferase family 2 [Geitlerinema sp. PCC 7407]
MNSTARVSVVIPCFNHAQYLEESVGSVITQSFQDFEIIIVDDGSTDETVAVANYLIQVNPEIQIRLISQPNSGQPAIARNRGISEAIGEYILPLDADDRISSEMLKECVALLDSRSDIGIVYTDRQDFGDCSETVIAQDYDFLALRYVNQISYCALFRRDIWLQVEGYKTNVKGCEYWDFWIAAGFHGYRGCRIPQPLFEYRNNSSGVYQDFLANQSIRWAQIVFNNYLAYSQGDILRAEALLGQRLQPRRHPKTPLISVVVPSYNHGAFLVEAIESLVSQTYQNWECIIVDDGSTDSTQLIAQRLTDHYSSSNIQLLTQKNSGVVQARRNGIQRARGEYILFLDSDDKIHPRFLEDASFLLSIYADIGFVYTNLEYFGAKVGSVNYGTFDLTKFLENNQATVSSLFKRQAYEDAGGFKDAMEEGLEDWELWVSMCDKGWMGYHLDRTYLYYRQHHQGSRLQNLLSRQSLLRRQKAKIICFHEKLYSPKAIEKARKELESYNLLIQESTELLNQWPSLSNCLAAAINKFRQGNDSSLKKIEEIRVQVAKNWQCIPDHLLESAFENGLGDISKILIFQVPDSEAEKNILSAQMLDQENNCLTDSEKIKLLLISMLYERPNTQSCPVEISQIPNWLLDTYLKYSLQPPIFFKSEAESQRFYDFQKNLIDEIYENVFEKNTEEHSQIVALSFFQCENFIHFYFNDRNLKNLYVKRAEILAYALQASGHELAYTFPERQRVRQKIRLGILAAHFTPSAETFAVLPFYEFISRDFEVILYSLQWTNHPLEGYCQASANLARQLPADLQSQVQMIRDDDLDLLLFASNITAVTNQVTSLALHRLARIQLTSVASVVTTGMKSIDYYLSSEFTDPSPSAEDHYREILIKLPGTVHCFSYGTEIASSSLVVTRQDLGIKDEQVVFCSGANFFKITPALLQSWLEILQNVPNSLLLLMPFGPNWSNAYPKGYFQKYLQNAFVEAGLSKDQFLVLDPDPVPNRADVKQYFKLADIYLDSYPFAGTTSLIEPLEVNLPIVTRVGEYFRGAMGAGILRALGLVQMVAADEAEYVRKAIALGTDPSLNQQCRQQIASAMRSNPAVLDSRSYALKIEQALKELWQRYQRDQLATRLKLREINLAVFLDWQSSEDALLAVVSEIFRTITSLFENQEVTLLINTTGIDPEEVEAAISSVLLNLMMEEEIDMSDTLEISLLEPMSDSEWEILASELYAYIKTSCDNLEVGFRPYEENCKSISLEAI